MQPIPDVSVVIVSYNTRDLLEQCLISVERDAGDVTLEIFVVDNASADGSADLVERAFPDVQLLRNTANVGFATANNQAVRLARGRYVLLLNPDTIVLNGAIAATVAFMDRLPEAGVSTCKVLNEDRTFQTGYGESFPSIGFILTGGSSLRIALASLLLSRRYLESSGLNADSIARAHVVPWVMGAFMMIRSDVMAQVGMLDENLFMYGEEPDFCYRATKAGWQMWYTPDGEIIHLGGQSTKQIDHAKVTNWLLTTYFYFFRKHRGAVYTVGCYIALVLSALVKLPVYATLEIISTGNDKRSRRRDKRLQMLHTLRWCVLHGPVELLNPQRKS